MGRVALYFADFITTMAAGIYFLVKPEDIVKVFKKSNKLIYNLFVKGLGVLVIIYGLYKLYTFVAFFMGA